jgi:hypothetical protein
MWLIASRLVRRLIVSGARPPLSHGFMLCTWITVPLNVFTACCTCHRYGTVCWAVPTLHSFAFYIPEFEGCERFQFRIPVPQSAGDSAFFQGNWLLLLCLIVLVLISGANNVHALFRTAFLEVLYSYCFC